MKDSLVIKQLSAESLKDLKRLAKITYNVNYSMEYLQAKYASAQYCGEQYLATVGYVNDEAVAMYGAIPQKFSRKGAEDVLLVETCDSYTHPDYQGKGFHKMLAEASYDLMRERGVKAVFAFHSDNTFHSCKKLGWEVQQELALYTINVSAGIPMQKVIDKFAVLDGYSKKRIRNSVSKHFDIADEFENEHCSVRYGNDYSATFINYKNANRCIIVKLGKCSLWLKIKSVIYVGAISNLDETNYETVIEALNRLAKSLGTDKIIIQLDKRHSAKKIFASHMETHKSYKIGFKCLDPTFDFSEVGINYLDFDNFY